MNKSIRTLVLPLLLTGAAFASASSHAAPFTGSAADYGVVDTGAAANQGRAVAIDANTRYVNVTNGDTVRFDVGGKAFTYTFDTYDNVNEVDLAKIAPAGVNVPNVRVYVAPNSSYVAG
jgi:hypothetical protein